MTRGSRKTAPRRYHGLSIPIAAPISILLALGAALPACKGRPDAPILTWHSISADAPSPESLGSTSSSGSPGAASSASGEGDWQVPQRQFIAQLDALSGAGFKTISLGALLDHADRGTPLPPKAIVLTFDDGTEDHFDRVLPALRAHGMRATFFVIAGKVGPDPGHRTVEPGASGPLRYLVWPEVRALRDAGMEIGAHGLTHARLPELPDDAALSELTQARSLIGAALGAPVDLMAWPFNSLRARHRALAKQAGYRAAVAGVVHGGSDRYSLYRIPIKASTDPVELVESLR